MFQLWTLMRSQGMTRFYTHSLLYIVSIFYVWIDSGKDCSAVSSLRENIRERWSRYQFMCFTFVHAFSIVKLMRLWDCNRDLQKKWQRNLLYRTGFRSRYTLIIRVSIMIRKIHVACFLIISDRDTSSCRVT